MRRQCALQTPICYQARLRRSSAMVISCGYFPVSGVSSQCSDTRASMFALIRSPSSSWCTPPLRIRPTKTSRGRCGRRGRPARLKRCCPGTGSASAAFGSKGDLTTPQPDFRFSPRNGHHRPRQACRFRATNGHGPLYSITSSAVASSCGGKLKPCALAVFKFAISSNFVGSCTGSSAGFSPLTMRLA